MRRRAGLMRDGAGLVSLGLALPGNGTPGEVMDPRRWKEIERIYQAAVEVEPEHRGALLEEACAGDDELRKEVESLLAGLSKANEVFKAPAMEVVARELARQPIPSLVGKTLGHYRIKDKIGEGGMGVVYKARDTHLDRFVAIKTLSPKPRLAPVWLLKEIRNGQ